MKHMSISTNEKDSDSGRAELIIIMLKVQEPPQWTIRSRTRGGT